MSVSVNARVYADSVIFFGHVAVYVSRGPKLPAFGSRFAFYGSDDFTGNPTTVETARLRFHFFVVDEAIENRWVKAIKMLYFSKGGARVRVLPAAGFKPEFVAYRLNYAAIRGNAFPFANRALAHVT